MSEALLVGSRKARAVYWICKKVLLWRGLEEDKKSRDKKVPSGGYQHLAPLCLCYSFEFTFPCFTLFFSVLEKSRHLALLCYNLLLEIPHHLAPICLASSHFISVLQYFYTLLCISLMENPTNGGSHLVRFSNLLQVL